MRIIKSILCYLILSAMLVGQNAVLSQNQKQLIKYADENAALGDFYGASLYYEKALKIDSVDIHLLYKYATALRKYNNYTQAAYYYGKVVAKDDAGKMFKDATYWLATMQKINGQYKEAAKGFKRVQTLYGKDKKGYYYLKSKQEIISCNYALRLKDQIMDEVVVKNCGDKLNTTQSEFGAIEHKKTLYFSSLRSDKMTEQLQVLVPETYKVAIYKAQKDSVWVDKGKIDATINDTTIHAANGTFSAAGDVFIFTRCDSLNLCQLYWSKFNGVKWGNPLPLSDKINEKGATTTQPSLTFIEGKEYLFFSSNRSGGYGDMDIWGVEMLNGMTFSTPFNLGKNINSPDPEITPFYHAPTKMLYFSSTWHSGFGGFDVFKSYGKPTQEFSDPENLKKPLNSQWNDFYFTIDSAALGGFLTSNRLGVYYTKGPTCCNDIWEFAYQKDEPLIPISTIISLDDLNKYLPVTLYFHNDRPGPKSLDTTVNDNYLTTYKLYKELQPTYRTEYSRGLEDQAKQDAMLDIDDYFNYYVDKGVSDLELFSKLLLEELRKGEKIEITIKGFASPLAKSDYNVNLTKRRITTLVNYLKEYGTGEFIPYLNNQSPDGGALTFVKIPFGEYTAAAGVSDDYYDQKNSIYNRKAAVERKIEIQSVTYAKKDSAFATVFVENGTQDFGKVKKGEILIQDFEITNTGNKPLKIIEVVSGDEGVKVEYAKIDVLPGQTTVVKVTFNTAHYEGKQVKAVTVIADAFPRTKRLVITAEVFD